jgi:DNA modification methylase
MTYRRKEQIGDATLYLGDCLEILPTLGAVDAVVTDPPYGVNGGSGTMGVASSKTKYSASWEDSEHYLMQKIIPAFRLALEKSDRAIITPGSPCAFLYPRPADIGALYQPATTGMAKWGRETVQPVLFYGKDPRAGLTIQPKHYQNTEKASDDRHPCAKPIGVATWMVARASSEGDSVLDPFMGSGTTGVACANLGRKFIGIEIEERYFDIACERIAAAYSQGRLFA